MTEEERLPDVTGRNEHVSPPAVVAWLHAWWPWLVLALGSAIIALGGILFSLHSP